jgi:catechol 2,3-dioxygenase-like lactoylglutathione lyase family enzyme
LFEVARPPLDHAARQSIICHPLGRGHHAFKVKAGDFAGARERLAAAGVESAAPIDWGNHDCIYFLDPDGNLLEMVSYR